MTRAERTEHTRLAVLLGNPVAHSLSPTIYNAAFRALGLDAIYVACRVETERLSEAVAGLRALGVLGANVTIPHKEAVVPLVDRLTPTAEAIGAANTLVFEPDGTLLGDNTDAAGFLHPLAPLMDRLRGQPVVLLGAGGAARAAAYAVLTRLAPARLTIAARRPEQAEALGAALAPHDARSVLETCPLDGARRAIRDARLLVNTTPVGMHPHVTDSPWSSADDFHAGQVVYDLVYAPARPRLLREAEAGGATTIGGLGMLIGQAALAFEQWTGQPLPLDAVHVALSTNPEQR